MEREILFSAKTTEGNRWVEGFPRYSLDGSIWLMDVTKHYSGNGIDEPPSDYQESYPIIRETLGELTGFIDKQGSRIFEGHRLEIPTIEVIYQTHTGDNIPNGSYTEPIDCALTYREVEVTFKDGCFGHETSYDRRPNDHCPLIYSVQNYWDKTMALDALDLKRGRELFDMDYSQAEEDLNYIMEEEGFNSLEEMFKRINGVLIIGNIHD